MSFVGRLSGATRVVHSTIRARRAFSTVASAESPRRGSRLFAFLLGTSLAGAISGGLFYVELMNSHERIDSGISDLEKQVAELSTSLHTASDTANRLAALERANEAQAKAIAALQQKLNSSNK